MKQTMSVIELLDTELEIHMPTLRYGPVEMKARKKVA